MTTQTLFNRTRLRKYFYNQNSDKAVMTDLNQEFSVDKMTSHSDGTLSVYRSYFYRHGETAQKWAERVKEYLKAQGWDVEVTGIDEHATWPKTSYFRAHITSAKEMQS